MKKRLFIILIGVLMIGALAAALFFNYIGSAEITDGTYRIVDQSEYPDARIVVKNSCMQFYDIDLNSIYSDIEIETYRKLEELGVVAKLSDDKLKEYSDLNAFFVNNPYTIDYDSPLISKTGTFRYTYYLNVYEPFGLGLYYDCFHKTIRVAKENVVIDFKKVWWK